MSNGALFAREFMELVGSRPSEADITEADRELGRIGIPGRASARRYVSTLPQFRNKYEPIIARVYGIIKETPPDEDTVRFFLDKFSDADYCPDALAEDIDAGIGPPSAACAPVCDAPRPCYNADMLSFAKTWESAAGKKIDVYEFIRYYPTLPDANAIAGIVRAQDSAMGFVDKVHFDFLGRRVSRDEFLERYLSDHDKPNFEAEVLGAVIGGEEYQTVMRKRMCSVHLSLFGVDIHRDDLDYVFAIAKGKRLELYSEGVAEEIMKAHDGMMSISESVNGVYNAVLNRDADAEEVRSCVVDFRCSSGAAAAALEKRLHGSLEFHDVIKARFRESYERSHGRQPKASDVYNALSRILKDHAGDMRHALDSI